MSAAVQHAMSVRIALKDGTIVEGVPTEVDIRGSGDLFDAAKLRLRATARVGEADVSLHDVAEFALRAPDR